MKMRIVAAVAVALALGVGQAHADARSCTDDEEAEADARLTQTNDDAQLRGRLIERHLDFGMPAATGPADNEEILVQDGYVMNHDNDLRTALWVGYRLTADDQTNAQGQQRVNCFRRDPRIGARSAAFPADYDEPRYDQGHLANDADLKDELIDQLNSYVMSNMSPQECRFNRGIWLSLESLTRVWATEYDTIHVMSGAIFDRNDDDVRDDDADALRMKSRSDKKRVAVPTHYYKIILRKDNDGVHSIAFLLKQSRRAHGVKWSDVRPDVERSISTIEEIENKSDLKLFPDIDRDEIAQSPDGEGWAMDKNASNLESGCPPPL
jgi:DNA/RNA endonuclease G (NUC1)